MASVLVHTPEESVTVSSQAVRRLLERGDGDAALLYLALLRHHGTLQPRALAGELRWDRGRIEAAEETLRQLGLVAAAQTPPWNLPTSGPPISDLTFSPAWNLRRSSAAWWRRWSGSWASA